MDETTYRDERTAPLPSWDLEATWETFANGTFHGLCRGVEVQKSADDLERYQVLVDECQPDVVIETGTRGGGSALWFKHELGLEVITIDVLKPKGRSNSGRSLEGSEDKLTVLTGSSIDPAVVSNVRALVEGKKVFVSLDADHHSAHVQAEIHTWAEFVSPGSYLVVEDACFDLFARNGQPDRARVGGGKIPEYGGTLDALERCFGVPTHVGSLFWRDKWLEGLTSVSHSPVGWWRRNESA